MASTLLITSQRGALFKELGVYFILIRLWTLCFLLAAFVCGESVFAQTQPTIGLKPYKKGEFIIRLKDPAAGKFAAQAAAQQFFAKKAKKYPSLKIVRSLP